MCALLFPFSTICQSCPFVFPGVHGKRAERIWVHCDIEHYLPQMVGTNYIWHQDFFYSFIFVHWDNRDDKNTSTFRSMYWHIHWFPEYLCKFILRKLIWLDVDVPSADDIPKVNINSQNDCVYIHMSNTSKLFGVIAARSELSPKF